MLTSAATVSGTGNITWTAATTQHALPPTGISVTVAYTLLDADGIAWETGQAALAESGGTYTLTRGGSQTVTNSSNSGSAISASASSTHVLFLAADSDWFDEADAPTALTVSTQSDQLTVTAATGNLYVVTTGASNATCTVNLPSPDTALTRIGVLFLAENAGTDTVVVHPATSDTIDGATDDIEFDTTGQYLELQANGDGTAWYIISKHGFVSASSGGVDASWIEVNGGDAVTTAADSGLNYQSAIAIGDNSESGTQVGTHAHGIAIGTDTIASANQGTAIGYQATVSYSGDFSVAIGPAASATGSHCVAVGIDSECNTYRSVALGNGATCTANESVVIGYASSVSAASGVCIGKQSLASGIGDTVIGNFTKGRGGDSVVIGTSHDMYKAKIVAIGYDHYESSGADYSIGIGNNVGCNGTDKRIWLKTDNASVKIGSGGEMYLSGDAGSTWKGVVNARFSTNFLVGAPSNSQLVHHEVMTDAITFPSGLSGSAGYADTTATAQTDFDVQKNGSSVGTIRFAIGTNAPTFIMASATAFAAGDRLKVIAQASADATLGDFSFTLVGQR